MSFIWPAMLYLLILVPLYVLLYLYLAKAAQTDCGDLPAILA